MFLNYLTCMLTKQILSRLKPAVNTKPLTTAATGSSQKVLPKLEDFLSARDYTGALTLLEVD